LNERDAYLAAGPGIDHQNPRIKDFVESRVQGAASNREKAVRLFYAVRDGWRYNPYRISMVRDDLVASLIFLKEEGHCIDKAVLYTAFLRAARIPARLCLAKVRNHIAAEKMIEAFGTDELAPHGYVELWLGDRWLKATPTFNRELCEFLGVKPLEFDGESDALFQQYDPQGKRFMEYLANYGSFEDVPYEQIATLLRKHYPHIFTADVKRFDKDMIIRLSSKSR
jgi:transglutaminase-like putative cysteine protease